MQRIYCFSFISLLFIQNALAQVDSAHIDKPYLLSVEEDVLPMEVQNTEEREVFAASRNLEKVFETAIATSIITADEIKQAGATNLPESLRLIPDLVVRQKSNGYYSVHIRSDVSFSLDDQSPNFDNTTVLLTINGIPFNNFYQGSIYWETVPVDLHDIKRIEVIKTPHTVFYGTGAATGVINIVTKVVSNNRLKAHTNFQGGTYNTYVHRGDAGFAVSEKLQFRISGYYHSRARFMDPYYVFDQQKYIKSDSLLFYHARIEKTNLYPERALQSSGLNAYAFWKINSQADVEIFAYTQNSSIQSASLKTGNLAFNNRTSKTNSINIKSKIYRLHANFSYQSGLQNLAVGYTGYEMEIGNIFSSLDYHHYGKFYRLKAGTSYLRNAAHNLFIPNSVAEIRQITSNPYVNHAVLGRNFVTDFGLYLSQNFYFFRNTLKLTGTGRMDYLNTTQQLHSSYQIASSLKIGGKNMVRMALSKGLQGTYVMDYFSLEDSLEQTYVTYKDVNPITVENFELGYRTRPLRELFVDFTLFHSKTYNFLQHSSANDNNEIMNSNTSASLTGITIDTDFAFNKLTFKTFVTLQSAHYQAADSREKENFTPSYVGGIACSYSMFLNKLKINTNLYFYDHSSFLNQYYTYAVAGKTITNLKISYNFWGEHTIYFNGRNILNNKSIEYPYADEITRLYLVGIDLTF